MGEDRAIHTQDTEREQEVERGYKPISVDIIPPAKLHLLTVLYLYKQGLILPMGSKYYSNHPKTEPWKMWCGDILFGT